MLHIPIENHFGYLHYRLAEHLIKGADEERLRLVLEPSVAFSLVLMSCRVSLWIPDCIEVRTLPIKWKMPGAINSVASAMRDY